MFKLLTLEYAVSFTAICVHILAIILLYRRKNYSRSKNQIYLLIGLCHTDSMFVMRSVALTLKLLPNLLRYCTELYLAIIYYFFMILLVLDRFLVCYLYLKYTVYCTPKKLLKIIYSMMFLSTICVLILLVTIHLEQISFPVINLVTIFVYTVIDALYVTVVAITYAYIFVVYKRQMKVRKFSYYVKKTHDQFQFFVPTLIIVTYILFTVFPDIWSLLIQINSSKSYSKIQGIGRILYLLGWLADPLIYVCNLYFTKCTYKKRKITNNEIF